MAPQVGFEVTATNEGLLAVLAQSTAAIKGAAAEAASSFAPVSAAFNTLKTAALGITAIFGGGAAFGAAVATTAALARGSIDLGLQLGVSASRASDLKVALNSVGLTQDNLSAATMRVTRMLVTHEDAFQRLGVATRDQAGNYRNTVDIILDVNTALAGLKEGTDRNVEAQRIYGRGWMEVMPMLRLTASVMDEAKTRAQALGLEVGQEQVANFIQYRGAMAGVQDVFRGIMNAIGEDLMPSLTALGQWFASIGPPLVEVFRNAIGGIVIAFNALLLGVQIAWDSIKIVLYSMASFALTVGAVLERALHGDFSGAKAAWTAGMADLKKIATDGFNDMADHAQAAHDRIAKIMEGHIATPIKEPTGAEAAPPPQTKSRMGQWQTQLAEQQGAQATQLAATGQFHEVSKAEELAYWQNILATNKVSAEEKLQLTRTIGKLEVAVAKEGYQAQLAQLKEEEAQYKNNLDAKLVLAKEYAQKVGEAEGFTSKAYADAAKEVVNIEREKVAQMNAIDATRRTAAEALALSQIDAEEKADQLTESLHKESFERLIAQEKSFEDQRYAIKRAALDQTLALEMLDPDKNVEAIAKTNAQIEALATAHAATLVSINQKLVVQQQAAWTSLFTTIQSGFTTQISKMLEGTETFSQGMRNLFMQIGDAVVQTLVKIAVQWATTQIQNLVSGQATAEGQIAASAGEAGAAGVASFAGAPYPIDLGAPAFGASMAAAAEGFSIAERGFDVPSGMMPMTQLHPKEMVLPEKYGDVIRGLSQGRGGAGGDIHLHATSPDARTMHDMLMSNKKPIAKALREYARKR